MKEDHYFKIKFREALEIIKLPHNLNRDGGLEVSTSWLPSILNRKATFLLNISLDFVPLVPFSLIQALLLSSYVLLLVLK